VGPSYTNKVGVIVLTNTDDANPTGIVRGLIAVVDEPGSSVRIEARGRGVGPYVGTLRRPLPRARMRFAEGVHWR
jgi:hypothetical protein